MTEYFAGLSAWQWLDIISLSLVLLGSLITLFLRRRKSKASPDENGLIPVAFFFNKEKLESKKANWDLFWECVLVLGLAFQIPAATHNILHVIELTNENLKLQVKLQPRGITLTQITNFVYLTKGMTKFPIRIEIGEPREEAFSYAVQIKAMLEQAGYSIPDSDTNQSEGIVSDATTIIYKE